MKYHLLCIICLFLFPTVVFALKPATPSNFTTSNITPTHVSLSWDESENSVGYRVYRNTKPLLSVVGLEIADSDIVEATVYGYTISAYNDDGESARTEPLIVRVPDGTAPSVQSLYPKNGDTVAPQLSHMSFVTNEDATCSFKQSPHTFITTGTNVHIAAVQLDDTSAQNITFNCIDAADNVSETSIDVTVVEKSEGNTDLARLQIQKSIDALIVQIAALEAAIKSLTV